MASGGKLKFPADDESSGAYSVETDNLIWDAERALQKVTIG